MVFVLGVKELAEGVESYEEDIKRLILDKQRIFGDLGENVIVFEKKLSHTKDNRAKPTIADCLIFSDKQGIIGIEIKTSRDSTKRLLRQLRAYSLTCDLVYVMCHDKHVEKVEQLLIRYRLGHVGIMAFTEFKGKPIVGKYREAVKSPVKSVYHAVNMLWKKEIVQMLGSFRHPAPRLQEELGINAYKVIDRGGMNGLHGSLVKSTYSKSIRKPQLIAEFISRLGEEEANRVLCNVFIHDRLHPERAIKLRHFNPTHKPKGEM